MSTHPKAISAPAEVLDAFTAANKLAAMGAPVFRVRPGAKLPHDAGWARGEATMDPFEIFDRFNDGGFNVGVVTTGLVVLDIDCKGSVNGFETLKALGLELPDTFTVRTGSGGAHLYFDARGEEFGQRPLGPGIDIRAKNGYVVGPGSIVDGLAYSITRDVPIAPLPASLAALLKAPREKTRADSGEASAIGAVDTPRRKQSARIYLRDEPPAVEGERNTRLVAVANRVMDLGISADMAVELISAHWNDRCLPPLDDDELERTVHNAARYRKTPIGSDDPAEGFEAVVQPVVPASVLEFPRDLSIDKISALQERALVKGLFLPGETGTVYGDSGSGKSFVTLDLAYHIAQGKAWVGRRVSRAPVLYVALEGVGGFQKRVIAASRHLGDPGDYFARLNLQVSLVKAKAGAEGARKVIDAFKDLAGRTTSTVGLIVIDTLARATAGDDENAVADMMAFLEHRAQAIAHETGAAVLIVHHTNKRGEERGSGSLRAGVEFALRIDREGDKRTVTGEKVKDGVEGKLFDFRLEQVSLGEDADGDPITSCIVAKSVTADRTKQCSAACEFLFEEAARENVNLSPKKRAGSKYAANWIHERAPDWSVSEIEAAIFAMTGTTLVVEEYRTGGKSGSLALRYSLKC